MQNTDLPASHGISSLAMSGFTALIGMREIADVKAGDQVLVSGAAGGVGSQAGFIARALGAEKVVGIAGGAEKCRLLKNRLGYDRAIDYKNEKIGEKLEAFFPNGIDVYFDNVFGEILDEVFRRINRRARIALCGRISEYLKSPEEYHRFRNLYRLGLQDAKLEAFFVYDYAKHFAEYERQLAAWIRAGKLKPLEQILEGLEIFFPNVVRCRREHRIQTAIAQNDIAVRSDDKTGLKIKFGKIFVEFVSVSAQKDFPFLSDFA